MAVEAATTINQLDATKPGINDLKSEGDDHIRLVKSAIKATLPNIAGVVTPTHTELNFVDGVTSAIQTQLDAKADISGETYTGAHDFAGASEVTLPANTSVGTVSATEIGYIDGLTSNAQAQIDSLEARKADISGEIYTGVHSFIGATINVATPAFGASGPGAASFDYVNNATLFTSIPGQTNNQGKVLTTDGFVATWQSVNQLPTLALGII